MNELPWSLGTRIDETAAMDSTGIFRREFWIVALLTIAFTAIAADEWKSFRFAEDGFAIDFPNTGSLKF
jgi:hypothetical protein